MRNALSARAPLDPKLPAMNEIETVQTFLAALASSDIERALTYVAPNVVYQNVPLAPARGIAEFEKQMRFFAKITDGFDVVTHHIASNGPVVLTERTDSFSIAGSKASFWVCGTFEVHDGKITLWRDSFDWLNVIVRTVRALPLGLLAKGTKKRVAAKTTGATLTSS